MSVDESSVVVSVDESSVVVSVDESSVVVSVDDSSAVVSEVAAGSGAGSSPIEEPNTIFRVPSSSATPARVKVEL